MTEEEEKPKEYSIRKMSTNDISGALQVFGSHHLYEAKHSLFTYLEIDCNGFYVAIDSTSGEIIGVCGGPFTRPDSAFIGLYAVRTEYFGQKIGQKLFKRVLDNIGDKNCGLFAIPEKVKLYRDQLNFKVVTNARLAVYFGKEYSDDSHENSVNFEQIIGDKLIDKVIEYDQQIHGFRRKSLLKLSFEEPECLSFAAFNPSSGDIIGYGSVRQNNANFATLSPVYANTKEIAKQIVSKLVNNFETALKNGFFYYTIDANESAIKLAEELHLERSVVCPLLYRTQDIPIDYQKIYSVLSPNFSL